MNVAIKELQCALTTWFCLPRMLKGPKQKQLGANEEESETATKTLGPKRLASRVEPYDVVSGIAEANAGKSIGQLLGGDANAAISTAKKPLGGKAVRNVMEALKEKGIRIKTAVAVIADEVDNEPRLLKLAEVEAYRKQVRTLFDSAAIPKVLSAALCDRLHLSPRKMCRCITMVDKEEALVMGDMVGGPVTVRPITTELACLVVRSSP